MPDYEQGRSRPNPYSPEDSIFGVIFPSCCEPAFFVNMRFYNYNDDVFKFVNLVRLAGAVGVDSGSGTCLERETKVRNGEYLHIAQAPRPPITGSSRLASPACSAACSSIPSTPTTP